MKLINTFLKFKREHDERFYTFEKTNVPKTRKAYLNAIFHCKLPSYFITNFRDGDDVWWRHYNGGPLARGSDIYLVRRNKIIDMEKGDLVS
jgi:hypothetical protein